MYKFGVECFPLLFGEALFVVGGYAGVLEDLFFGLLPLMMLPHRLDESGSFVPYLVVVGLFVQPIVDELLVV